MTMRPKAARSVLKKKIEAALAAQWGRATADAVELELPLPISTNELWRPAGGKMIKTARYETWFRDAGNMINQQRAMKISGPYAMTLVINRRRTGIDLDNAVKAASDALQENGVIENDRLAQRITLSWSDDVAGMRVTVEKWKEAA